MKILLYGLGKLTEQIEKLINKEHEIIGYTDSFAALNIYNNKTFYKVDEINSIIFDYIVITVRERRASWEIRQNLISKYNIDSGKIIPFSVYANHEIVENTVVNSNDICGIILGNSHAYHAYLPDYLDEKFINISCPSQDIYHNYKAFEKYLRYYGDTIKKLKYIIFDLYDYNFFNLDVSKTRGLFDYILWGGVADKHNYDYNVHYNKSFEDELFKKGYMLPKLPHIEMKCMDSIFGNYANPIVIETKNNNVNCRWSYIKVDEPLATDKFLGDVVTKRFEETIRENIQIMERFIKQVKNSNSGCKIIFTLIPRYITMEKTLSVFMKEWKLEFELTMRELQKNGGGYIF